VEIDFIFILV